MIFEVPNAFLIKRFSVSIPLIMYFFCLLLMWFIMLVDLLVLNFPCLCEEIYMVVMYYDLKHHFIQFVKILFNIFTSLFMNEFGLKCFFLVLSLFDLESKFWKPHKLMRFFLFILLKTFWIRLKFILEDLVEYAHETVWPRDSPIPKMDFNCWFNYFNN